MSLLEVFDSVFLRRQTASTEGIGTLLIGICSSLELRFKKPFI